MFRDKKKRDIDVIRTSSLIFHYNVSMFVTSRDFQSPVGTFIPFFCIFVGNPKIVHSERSLLAVYDVNALSFFSPPPLPAPHARPLSFKVRKEAEIGR